MMRGNSTTTRRVRLKRFRKTPYPQKVMSEQDTNSNGDIVRDFQSTGRTGRRNALADVLSEHQHLTTSDLPLKLEKLSTDDSEGSSSKSNCVNENQNSSNSPSTANG